MRILYVGNAIGFTSAPRYYTTPLRMVNGFIRNGHVVFIYNDRDHARYANIWRSSKRGVKAANHGLLKDVEAFRPDLVVLGHCEMISNATINEIRRLISGVKIVYRNVDSLAQGHNIERLHRRAEAVDGIFLTTSGKDIEQFSGDNCFVSFFPNMIDASIDSHQAFACAETIGDVFFAGEIVRDMADQRRRDVDRIINELSDLRLSFHGSVVNKTSLLGTEYLDILGQCRMGLSLDRSDKYWLYASERLHQYLGNGVLTFVYRGKGFEQIFADDEVAFYSDLAELIEKCRQFAANDEDWRNVAAKGYNKARQYFSAENVTQYIIERSFDLPLSRDYPWHDL